MSLVLAAAAVAGGGSAGQTYNAGGGNVQQQVNQGVSPAAGSLGVTKSGQLPFTGLDLALMVVGGGALVLVGAVLRRASKRGA